MSSVDTRVVEMHFDNAQFEKGVSETLKSLDSLSSKLDAKTLLPGLNGLKSAVSGISFESIGSGLDGLLSKAGTVFGGITDMVGNFSKTIMGVSGIAGVLMGGGALFQAITGGSQRATNIENAKFQLEGLGVAWRDIVDDINYAVDGTAYGLDSAAKASAQLVASNVSLGDSMKKSLRAISGVAAQTNSDYDSIASIFTTVAGQGKLMTMQLRQLESRGLNVAAALGEQLGYTEAEIREMVTDGVINFETFANAMDDAFGEHAKEANKTFTGAVANMKAALNKIGADFITPLHEFERQAALGFRSIFNAVRAGFNMEMPIRHIAEFGNGATGLADNLSHVNSIVSVFSYNMTRLGEDVFNALDSFAESGVIQKFVASFLWIDDAIFHGTWVNMSAIVTGVLEKLSNINLYPWGQTMRTIGENLFYFSDVTASQIPTVIDILGNLAGSVLNVFSAIGTIVSPIIDAFGGAIAHMLNIGVDGTSSFLQGLANWTQGLQDFTANLGLSSEAMEAIHSVFESVFTAIFSLVDPIVTALGGALATVGQALTGLWPVLEAFASVIGSLAGPAITVVAEALSVVIGFVSSLIAQLPTLLDEIFDFQGVADFFNGIADAARQLFEGASLDKVIGFFDEFRSGAMDVDGVSQNLINVWNQIVHYFSDAGNVISEKMGEATSVIMGLWESFKGLFEVTKAYADDGLSGLTEKFKETSDVVEGTGEKSFFDSFLSGLGDAAAGVKDFVDNFTLQDAITAISAVITGFLTGAGLKFVLFLKDIPEKFGNLLDSWNGPSGIFKSIKSGIDSVFESLTGSMKTLQTQIKAQTILKIAEAIALLAASLFLISLIPQDKLLGSLGAIAALSGIVAGFMVGLAALIKWMNKGLDPKQTASASANIAAMGVALMSIAGAILLLSASVAVLSLLDPAKMWSAVGAIVVLIGAMAGLSAVLGHMKTGYAELLAFAAAMAAIGLAIIPLTAAVALLGFLPWQNVVIGIGELSLMLWAIYEVTSKLGESLVRGDAANIAAFAAVILSIGLAIIPLVAAVTVLGLLPWQNVLRGVALLSGLMIGLGTAVGVMAKLMKPQIAVELLAASVAALAFGSAMIPLAAAVALVSALPAEGLGRAVDAISQIMIEFALLSTLMLALGTSGEILAIAGALAGFAVAVGAIAVSVGLLSMIPIQAMAVGVGALIVVLAAFAGLGALLTRVIPGAAGALVVFGAAILLTGLGMAATGAGIMFFANGIAMLGVIAPAAAENIGTAMETMSEHVAATMPIMAAGLAEGIAAFANTLSEKAPELSDASANTFSAFIAGAMTTIPQIVEFGVSAILAFLEGVASQIGAIVAAGLDILTNLIVGIASGIGQIIEAGIMLAVMLIKGIADGIRNNAQLVAMAVQSLAQTIGSVFLGGLADIVQLIPGVGGEWADALRGTAGDLASGAEAASSAIDEAFNERYGDILEGGEETMEGLSDILSGSAPDLESASEEAGGSMISGFDGVMDMLPEDARQTMQELTGNLEGVDLSFAGSSVGGKFENSMLDKVDDTSKQAVSKTESMVSSMGAVDSSGSGSNVGSNFGQGVYNGIDSWVSSVASKAAQMVRDAKAAANAEQDAHSPSRDMMKSGGWFAEGFMIGISNMIPSVARTASSMVASAKSEVDGIGFAIADALDAVDWDSEPTIKPVLDLSDIEYGVGRMNRLMVGNNVMSATMIGTTQPASLAQPSVVKSGNTIQISLNYDAGANANDLVMGMANIIKTRGLMEA